VVKWRLTRPACDEAALTPRIVAPPKWATLYRSAILEEAKPVDPRFTGTTARACDARPDKVRFFLTREICVSIFSVLKKKSREKKRDRLFPTTHNPK
jgi:hypothetical protein